MIIEPSIEGTSDGGIIQESSLKYARADYHLPYLSIILWCEVLRIAELRGAESQAVGFLALSDIAKGEIQNELKYPDYLDIKAVIDTLLLMEWHLLAHRFLKGCKVKNAEMEKDLKEQQETLYSTVAPAFNRELVKELFDDYVPSFTTSMLSIFMDIKTFIENGKALSDSQLYLKDNVYIDYETPKGYIVLRVKESIHYTPKGIDGLLGRFYVKGVALEPKTFTQPSISENFYNLLTTGSRHNVN